MIPFTPKWFRQKEKERLEERARRIRYTIKRMIEVARIERKCATRHNLVCSLVKRLVELDKELDDIKKQIKNINEGRSPYLA